MNRNTEIRFVAIGDLKFNSKNLRLNDVAVEAVAKSIDRFGFNNPVLVRPDMTVIAGHTRLKAAKQLNLKTIPCRILDHLSETEAKAYNLADNRTGELADWDVLQLSELLLELKDEDDSDLLFSLGWDEIEISDLIIEGQSISESESESDDDIPEPPKIPITKTGDIIRLGKHRLMCGDATKQDDVVKLMDGKKADMVFTDPPYGIGLLRNNKNEFGGSGKLGKSKIYRTIINDESVDVAKQFYLLMKEQVDVLIIWGGNYFTDFLPPSRCWIIWDKRRPVELSFCGIEMAWVSVDRHPRKYEWLWDGSRRKGKRKDEMITRVHPTQKPVGMIVNIFRDFEFRLCIDPFLGSGSTLIACEKTGRTCYGMEIDPVYCDVIVERWENYTDKKAIREIECA